MSEGAGSILARHITGRDRWLSEAKAACTADEAVEAALLYGSFGRGDVDSWSDVDLIIFAGPQGLPSLVAEGQEFIHRFGSPLYVPNSPWNAPRLGAQVNVLYPLDSGLPLYVDFNFWPLEMAGRPPDTKVLYARAPRVLPPATAPFAQWAVYERPPGPALEEADQRAVRHARFGMLPIAVKFCVRGERTRLVQLLTGIGAPSVPEGARAEMATIRALMADLSEAQPAATVSAVEAMCAVAEEVLGIS